MALIIDAALDALAIPADGPVLLVLTLPDHGGRFPEDDVTVIRALREFAEQVAPGQATALVLPHGFTIQSLTDRHLTAIGLARVS